MFFCAEVHPVRRQKSHHVYNVGITNDVNVNLMSKNDEVRLLGLNLGLSRDVFEPMVGSVVKDSWWTNQERAVLPPFSKNTPCAMVDQLSTISFHESPWFQFFAGTLKNILSWWFGTFWARVGRVTGTKQLFWCGLVLFPFHFKLPFFPVTISLLFLSIFPFSCLSFPSPLFPFSFPFSSFPLSFKNFPQNFPTSSIPSYATVIHLSC